MFRHLIVANKLEDVMKQNGLKDHHMKLIEDLIIGEVPENIKAMLPECKWSGSSYDAKGREFLFEVYLLFLIPLKIVLFYQ